MINGDNNRPCPPPPPPPLVPGAVSPLDATPDGVVEVPRRTRVLLIYSPDHPLYTAVILKFCSFLMAKCGTDVVLDRLDLARLGQLGGIQWLDWHREQIECSSHSSDKILILCSQGVQAKWRAMCGGAERVVLREDLHSPVGDMLSPALGLIVPRLVRSASLHRYIVAYFEGVCSEEDVPSPFNVAVRYKLMEHFEEVFFRILGVEKQRPGRVNLVQGVGQHEYALCPSGQALKEAVEAFRTHQQKNPRWFQEELVMEEEEVEVEVEVEVESDAGHAHTDDSAIVGCIRTGDEAEYRERGGKPCFYPGGQCGHCGGLQVPGSVHRSETGLG